MSKPIISVVINADSRYGYKNYKITVGEFGEGSLQGCRSIDFLTEGLKNKMNFFRGHECQCIMFLDEHEPIPDKLFMEISEIVHSYGNGSALICKSNNRTRHRWYDYITLEALKLATGDYIVHFDQDSNAFRSDESDIVDAYIDLLGSGYKYICCPIPETHKDKWYWASTQFFICKKETLNLDEVEKCFDNKYLEETYGRMRYDPHPCCFEHTIGLMVKEGEVLYPPRENDSYLIFCWWTYQSGLLKKLNEMPYPEAKEFIINCGLTASSY